MIKHIPNTITSLNLLSGLIGVICAINGLLEIAFVLMILAAIFDFFDGLSARALNAYSDIGKELDSLADLVSFGALPSFMLYKVFLIANPGNYFALFPLLIAVFTALRLAKFNLDSRQAYNFIGLPSPSSAMFIGALSAFYSMAPSSGLAVFFTKPISIIVITVLISYLLVSEIPMFALKFSKSAKVSSESKLQRNIFFLVSIIFCISILVLHRPWPLIFLFIFLFYILMNLAFFLIRKF